jgi:hypothetical protein
LGQAADEEEILKLRGSMLAAVQEDIQANAEGKPAMAKLRMLPQVTATLQKYTRSRPYDQVNTHY